MQSPARQAPGEPLVSRRGSPGPSAHLCATALLSECCRCDAFRAATSEEGWLERGGRKARARRERCFDSGREGGPLRLWGPKERPCRSRMRVLLCLGSLRGIAEKKERGWHYREEREGLGRIKPLCRQEKENEESSKLRSYQVGKYLSIVELVWEGHGTPKFESQRALKCFF